MIARRIRQEATFLTPIAASKFSGNTWFFGILQFISDGDKIKGFKASSDRAIDVWFKKME